MNVEGRILLVMGHALRLFAFAWIGVPHLACSSNPSTSDETSSNGGVNNGEQRPREEPTPCSLFYEEVPLCHDDSIAEGGAGGAGGVPTSGACFLKQVASLSCPSYATSLAIARNAQSALDVLVGQQGRDGRDGTRVLLDDQVYVDALRLSDTGDLMQAERRFYQQGTFPRQLLISASTDHDTLKAHLSMSEGFALQLTTPFNESQAPINIALQGEQPTDVVFGADGGSTVLGLKSEETGVSLIDGILGNQRLSQLPIGAMSLAVTPDDAGAALGVTITDDRLALWRASEVDQPVWETTINRAQLPPQPEIDVLSFPWNDEEIAAVLYPQGGDVQAQLISLALDGSEISASGVATHTSTCDFLTIGIVCNRCQTGQRCGTTDDQVIKARLLRADGRLFVVYLAEREVVEKEVELSTSDIFGLGCICQAKKQADVEPTLVLAVKELTVVEGEEGLMLSVTERGSWTMGPPQDFHVAFSRGQAGQLDLVLGPQLQVPELSISEFPAQPSLYRVYHLSAE